MPDRDIIEMMYRKLFVVAQLARLLSVTEVDSDEAMLLTKTQNLLAEIDEILNQK